MEKHMSIKYFFKQIITLFALLLLLDSTPTLTTITEYSYSDPYPVFTTLDPHLYLQMRQKLRFKGYDLDGERDEWFGFSISPFSQSSNSTRIDCMISPVTTPATQPPSSPCGAPCPDVDTCLGNIHGRWSMLGLLFGNTPEGQPLPKILQDVLMSFSIANVASRCAPEGPINTSAPQLYIDNNQNIGFFDVPMRYRKQGIRFDFKWKLGQDFGISLDTGIANISQVIGFQDRTPQQSSGCVTINGCTSIDFCTLEKSLMENLENIAPAINLDITDFHKLSVEDIRAGIFWRRAFAVNTHREDWEPFLLIPFAHVEGSFAVGARRKFNKFTSLSFGNNDHHALGVSAGLNIDFTETIEIGGECGLTHYFGRDVCNMPVPTSAYQSGIYPFTTTVHVNPANNWHVGLKMFAYHFIGDLSFSFQYLLIEHNKDSIKLKKPDPAFLPKVLEELSPWKSQLADVSFNYDISPDFSIGFLWQTPLPSKNTYRATTLMLSFNAQF